ncbi:MAG TPA: hypothetical protein VGN81_01640 [Pseudonocardiaceae bacterium]|jgi:tetrahydromethanopterin S-methyltransferase subunit F
MSADETSFVQWRERAKDERKSSGNKTALIIGIAAIVVVAIVLAIILL